MSVKFHEAFSLDSARRQFNFSDHFLGDSLRDLWTSTGTGSAAVVDAQDGGVCRITTGATATNIHRIDWGDIRSLHVSKQVTMEVRLKLEQVTDIECRIYLWYDGGNLCGFKFDDSGDTNWEVVALNDAGAPVTDDSGITPDTNWHIFRIECFPAGEVHYYIDGVECGNSPVTTEIPVDDYLEPYIIMTTEENAAHYCDVDYVAIRQEI